MKSLFSILIAALFFSQLISCRKENSDEGNKIPKSDSLSSDYPFATGYCDGVSLGVPIIDTINYLPSSVDTLPKIVQLDMPEPGDQGSQGSCSAWATVYGAGTYYIHSTTGKPYSDTGNLSPKFTYNQITKGDCKCTSILEHLYLLKTQGAASLNVMPYDASECSIQPDSMQKVKAEHNKIQGWQKLNLHDLILIKRAIHENKPVLFAIAVDDGFKHITSPYVWKQRVGSTGQGHAMVITGYDDDKKAFRVLNSWSKAWGDKGFVWIDYEFFKINVFEGGYIII